MAENHIAAPSLRAENKHLSLEIKELKLSLGAKDMLVQMHTEQADRLRLSYNKTYKSLLEVLHKRAEPKLSDRVMPLLWVLLGCGIAAAAFAIARPLSSLWNTP